MDQLKLSIKPKLEPNSRQCLKSSGYSVKVNDWELGRGVTDFKLEMSADKKPKATITFTPDIIDVDDVMFEKNYSEFMEYTQKQRKESAKELEKAKLRTSGVECEIDQYIKLRIGLSKDDWNTLNALYDAQMHEKERQLTKNLSMSEIDIDKFRSDAQELLGISE